MLMDSRLARDRATPASQAFYVLAVELDTGLIILADAPRSCGLDVCLPAVLSWSSLSAEGAALDVEAQALPAETDDAWWINREAMILECTPDMGSIYDGRVVFDGIVEGQPDSTAGVLSLRIGPAKRRVRPVPDYGLITATAWPLAADSAMGQAKPLIVGAVDACPLLPVRLPAATQLAADALPGAGQLEVDDAAGLPASGAVMVDGVSYAYDAKSAEGNILLGVTVTASHRQGTAVAVVGDTVFLAAGHTVASVADVRADVAGVNAPITGGVVDLVTATVIFATPPLRTERSERFALTTQFDQVGAGATALNAINAIRAVTSTVNQSAASLPGAVTAASVNAAITFARPSGRIVKGIYTVAFTVGIGSQIGWARVKIGNEVVWFMEPPASVIYNWSPATILFDDDSDLLPVVVEVAEGGSADQVSVTVASASRLISLGNLDDANFAVLRGPSNLLWRADQTDVIPDLGPIAHARLWVRWFAAGTAALPAATVKFGGKVLGTLAQTQLANATLSQTISTNVTSQGTAALPQQNISTLVSGGTASLSHTAIPQKIVLPAAFSVLASVGGFYPIRGFSLVPPLTGWDGSAISVVVSYAFKSATAPTNLDFGPWLNIRRADNSLIAQANFSTLSGWVQIASDIWQAGLTIAEAPASVYWDGAAWVDPPVITPSGGAFSYNARIAVTSVAQVNTPASGSSNPLPAQNLGHSGTAVATSNGAINFTVAAPPRVVDSLFDLSWVRTWADLVGQAEVAYTAGGPDLCLNQVALIVDYDAQVLARAETLTATVTGLSGNPADVIELLAGYSGQGTDSAALARLSAWATANGIAYARRLAQPEDALTLLQYALDQVNAIAVQRDGRLAPIRRLDLASDITRINEAELLAPAGVSWAERMDNAITIRYAEDYATDAGHTRVVQATTTNNLHCRRSVAAIKETRAVDIEAGFIRADATASRMLTDLARWAALPRRVLTLPCSYAQTAAEGDLIEYLPLGADPGDGILARITGITTDGGWPTLTAEEIPAP